MIFKRKVYESKQNDHLRENDPFFLKSLNLPYKEMYGNQFGEFVCGYWGLQG